LPENVLAQIAKLQGEKAQATTEPAKLAEATGSSTTAEKSNTEDTAEFWRRMHSTGVMWRVASIVLLIVGVLFIVEGLAGLKKDWQGDYRVRMSNEGDAFSMTLAEVVVLDGMLFALSLVCFIIWRKKKSRQDSSNGE
jgi:hypothetical protein